MPHKLRLFLHFKKDWKKLKEVTSENHGNSDLCIHEIKLDGNTDSLINQFMCCLEMSSYYSYEEESSCYRDHMAYKAPTVYYLALYRKDLPTLEQSICLFLLSDTLYITDTLF